MILFIAAGLFLFFQPHAFALGATAGDRRLFQSVCFDLRVQGFEMAAIPAGANSQPPKRSASRAADRDRRRRPAHHFDSIVCVGTLRDLAHSLTPLADAGTQFLGTAGARSSPTGAIISITGNLNVAGGCLIACAVWMGQQRQLRLIGGFMHVLYTHVAICAALRSCYY